MTYRSKLDAWLSAVIEAGWLAALVLAPLFFNVFSSRVFEPDKISLIRTIALIMLSAWLIKFANSGELWLPAYASAPGGDTEPAEPESASLLSRLWRTPLLLPILLLVLAYLVSTLFSVARYVSWWGSYQRLQGTFTFLSYVIIALITMSHLRQPIQIRRIQHVVVLVSLPIAIYAILQHRDRDPLPWGGDTQTRVAANAGNAIFLAAYLIMAFFFTLERVYSSFAHLLGYRPEDDAEQQDMPTALAGGFYLFVLLVQILVIFWTQSRGPWIGWMLGLYLFVLLLFTALRPKNYRAWTIAWVGLGVSAAILLLAANTLPMFDGLRDIPYVGRLTTLLEAEGGTGRVRVLIWQGAADMVQPHEPLVRPDGSTDAFNAIRPLVGYGPEAMWIAYNPFYPPELAQLEARNASPDRSHNETWDSLVITGILGFLAYLMLFVAIFYWALRWLGLLVNRRDAALFGALLFAGSLILVVAFFIYDGSWRFFGVALPAGMMIGLGVYVTLAAFIHPSLKIGRDDLARQLLIITLLATIAAHFTEIHFGIAIAATRTYFWIYTALLLVLGMQWAQPEVFAVVESVDTVADDSDLRASQTASSNAGRRRNKRNRQVKPSLQRTSLPPVAATVMTDLLIFLTLVFIYTTNTQRADGAFQILTNSILRRVDDGQVLYSPFILYLMLFTWFVAATIGQASESLQHRQSPGIGWWLRGYALHALIVWGGWFIYALYEAGRMRPAESGALLDDQIAQVTSHFHVFTWIVITWLLVAGAVYAWPWLREQRLRTAERWLPGIAAATVVCAAATFVIVTVNVGLVKADTIYKQGQQFDASGDWLSSVELYRRSVADQPTEDHYMLFLGRALLERAKQAQPEGAFALPADADLNDVIALDANRVNAMNQEDTLRAAEIVLTRAQELNPLNTDHTANLARLYQTWASMSSDAEMRQELLDKSVAAFEMAVQLSPNAALLWNQKGAAYLASGDFDQAEEDFMFSLSLDQSYDQTYLRLAEMYDISGESEKAIDILHQGIEALPRNASLYNTLGVVEASQGDLEQALESYTKVVELQPNNASAMRNIALFHRDLDDVDSAIEWALKSLERTGRDNVAELSTANQLVAQLYQTDGQVDQAISYYESSRELTPDNVSIHRSLANLYLAKQDTRSAVDAWRRLMELEPANYEHPYAIAQVLQQVGQPDDALTFAIQALDLAPPETQAAVDQLVTALESN